MRIGFQGEPGAFSEEAARTYFGGEIATVGFLDFDALVGAVDRREVAYGMLPCENSIYGSIARAYDLLLAFDGVTIAAETQHAIEQCLIGPPGARMERVRTVRSHPVALEQCRRFFAANPQLRREVAEDTAGAVRDAVAHGDPAVAAIGPALAAQRYGGELLERAIQDETENLTRFFVIASRAHASDGERACIAFVLAHEPGSLVRALATIAQRGLNLRSLVARPRAGRPFEYVFYAELDCPRELDAAALANEISRDSRLLGRY